MLCSHFYAQLAGPHVTHGGNTVTVCLLTCFAPWWRVGREGTPDSDAGKSLTPAQRNHLRVKSWTKVGAYASRHSFNQLPLLDLTFMQF